MPLKYVHIMLGQIRICQKSSNPTESGFVILGTFT